MAELTLADILNDCIDRLSAGQTVEDCLQLYPAQATRLDSMLGTGLLVRRMEGNPAEVLQAQENIWSRIEQAYHAPLPSRPLRLPRQYLWLAAVLAGLLILAGAMAAARNSGPGDPLYGVRVFIESIFGGAPGPTPTPTLTPSSTETATAAASATPSATVTSTATPTASPTETPASSATPPAATEEVMESVTGAIEGPVQAIDGNVITIYGIEITIDPDDPLLEVIEVDDVIRVEGDFTGAVVVGNVTVVGSGDEVFLNDAGEVWRDDGTCNNPPPAWAPAHGWRRRCQGGNTVQPGNQGGMGMGMGMGMGSGSDS